MSDEPFGRVATTAHPLCRCGKPHRPGCGSCSAKVNKPCRHFYGDPLVLSEKGRAVFHRRAAVRVGQAKDCPMHR